MTTTLSTEHHEHDRSRYQHAFATTGTSGGIAAGSHLTAAAVEVKAADGTTLLQPLDVAARPGELVAIVGPSGAGKSTLLDVLAGNLEPTDGSVTVDGVSVSSLSNGQRGTVGFVPQHDDLHHELPLDRVLTYAARLRLPRGTSRSQIAAAVQRVLSQVELEASAKVPVGQLSGGQRRRASVAVELLTEPRVCLLDEPTSGLDPATADTVVSELRALADAGRTMVFVTHNANDLRHCDRIVALAEGGRLVFDGTQAEAIALAESSDVDQVHRTLTGPCARSLPTPLARPSVSTTVNSVADRRTRPSRFTQWLALTGRSLETVVRNRLTLGIMVGSPAMVIAMFAVLFRPGAFDPATPSPTSAIMIAFWVAFGGFFFGLTYGLLQICPEIPAMRRERRSGVGSGVQVAAKFTALAPLLVVINVMMLVVLRWLDRLPAVSSAAYGRLSITMALGAVAALALGLLASALVTSPAQASLALPMLCFPAVLFSGAILPVPVMATVGRGISAVMPDRWAFELIGKDLGLRPLFAGDPSPLGPSLLEEYGTTWDRAHGDLWIVLGVFVAVLAAATWAAVERRCAVRRSVA